jgi:hypothetical protein
MRWHTTHVLATIEQIDHRGREAAVAQQSADGHQVDSGFQQAHRVRVSHRMRLLECVMISQEHEVALVIKEEGGCESNSRFKHIGVSASRMIDLASRSVGRDPFHFGVGINVAKQVSYGMTL